MTNELSAKDVATEKDLTRDDQQLKSPDLLAIKALAQFQKFPVIVALGELINRWGKATLNTWRGLAFERLCLWHVPQIKAALGISGVLTEVYAWRHVPMAVLWLLAALTVWGYYRLPPFAAILEPLAKWQRETGWPARRARCRHQDREVIKCLLNDFIVGFSPDL